MNLDEPVWDVTVFTKNRDRLLDGDVAREFLSEVVKQAQAKDLTSDEHFTVDGALIEAWASLKSSGEDEESAGRLSWCRMSRGRSVPARGQRGQSEQNRPQLQASYVALKAVRTAAVLNPA
jgi:hypothetical protein